MKVKHGRIVVQRFVLPIVAEIGRTSLSDFQKKIIKIFFLMNKIIKKLLQKNVIIDIIRSSEQVDLFII